mgnify:CR=1 FL=1
MAYLISEEAKDLLQDVHEFCENEVKEQCKAYDVSGEWPKEIYDKAIEMQLHSLEVPEEYGGPGLSRVDVAALIEEMAIADAGFATTISASGLGTKPVLIAGNEEQKKHVCQKIIDGGFGAFCLTEPGAGSDASAGTTTAVKDGDEWVLNGRKCFITNGPLADYYMVVALTNPELKTKGLTAFIVEREWEGVSIGKIEDKCGIRCAQVSEVIFDNVRVPKENMLGEEGKGFAVAMKDLDGGRIGVAAQGLGIAKGAYDIAFNYLKEREQFGKPLYKNQYLAFKMAELETEIEMAQYMLYKAATDKQEGRSYSVPAAKAKMVCTDAAMHVATEAVQMLGGNGYMKEYHVERMMRDAKITQIYEGTNEIQKLIVSGAIFR